jgi:hypothetical protein
MNEQLDALKGKTFFYQNKNVTLESYKYVSGIYILFMPGPKNFTESELDLFFKEIKKPVETLPTAQQFVIPQEQMVYFEPTKANEDVKNALLDAIKQVKENKNFIAQARAIVDISNAIVNIQKAEHDFIKLSKNLK